MIFAAWFKKNRPVYFPDGDAELYEDWTAEKMYEHGW
jgi:hypothetical protein